jgi:hypothetical protein
MRLCGIRDAMELRPGSMGRNPAEAKRKLREYRDQHVRQKAKLKIDDVWVARSAQQEYLKKHGTQGVTVKLLGDHGVLLSEMQVWAKFRIQGAFKLDGEGNPVTCRLCALNQESSLHLLLDCEDAAVVVERWAGAWGIALPSPGSERIDLVFGAASHAIALALPPLAMALQKSCCERELPSSALAESAA